MQEKRWDIAERSFLKSLEVEPDDAKTYYLIARARFEAGNRQGAMAAVGEAIRRVPKQPEFLELRKQIAGETPAAGPEPQVQ
jgi:cytochrome c-type biogenesis protein CcmH/NrfG